MLTEEDPSNNEMPDMSLLRRYWAVLAIAGAFFVLLLGIAMHRAFGLTKAEGRILAVLVRCGLAETSALYDALYGFNELDEPERPNEAVRSHMKRMRRKLRPIGVEIETHYGFGFALGDEGRAVVRRAVEVA